MVFEIGDPVEVSHELEEVHSGRLRLPRRARYLIPGLSCATDRERPKGLVSTRVIKTHPVLPSNLGGEIRDWTYGAMPAQPASFSATAKRSWNPTRDIPRWHMDGAAKLLPKCCRPCPFPSNMRRRLPHHGVVAGIQ